jgi:hypothetical protein
LHSTFYLCIVRISAVCVVFFYPREVNLLNPTPETPDPKSPTECDQSGKEVNTQGVAFDYLDQVTKGGGSVTTVTSQYTGPSGAGISETEAGSSGGAVVTAGGAGRASGGWGIQLEGLASHGVEGGDGGVGIDAVARSPAARPDSGPWRGGVGDGGEGGVLSVMINSDEHKLQSHLQVWTRGRGQGVGFKG